MVKGAPLAFVNVSIRLVVNEVGVPSPSATLVMPQAARDSHLSVRVRHLDSTAAAPA